MHGDRVASGDEVADGIRQVELTLRIDRLQPVERGPEKRALEDVDRGVRLGNRELRLGRIDGFDDRLEMPAGIANDSAVAPDVVRREREHRRRHACSTMRRDEILEECCRQKRCVA